jgi:hypothetical protein
LKLLRATPGRGWAPPPHIPRAGWRQKQCSRTPGPGHRWPPRACRPPSLTLRSGGEQWTEHCGSSAVHARRAHNTPRQAVGSLVNFVCVVRSRLRPLASARSSHGYVVLYTSCPGPGRHGGIWSGASRMQAASRYQDNTLRVPAHAEA